MPERISSRRQAPQLFRIAHRVQRANHAFVLDRIQLGDDAGRPARARAEGVRKRLEDILDVYVRDDVKARELLSDGSHRMADGALGVRAQEILMGRRSG